MTTLQTLEEAVAVLNECVQELASEFPLPDRVPSRDHFIFRHTQKTVELLWIMKAVRIASANNAAIELIRSGFPLETYALCRMIDEACEDVWFLAAPRGENGQPDRLQLRFIEEFFQEEFEDENDPLSTMSRDRVPRKQIRAAISRLSGNPLDPSTHDAVAKTLYQSFSGFVHGAYVHIMEIFGGDPPQFHTNGMLGTLRMEQCMQNQSSYICRSLMSIELAAVRLKRAEIAERLRTCCLDFSGKTGSLKSEQIEQTDKLHTSGLAKPD